MKLFVILSLSLLTGCSGLMYFPSRDLIYPPETQGLKPIDVFFKTNDGLQLYGWYFKANPKKDPKAIVVFFHGNAENISSHYLNIAWIIKYGYDVFAFDYRGYGRSEGEPSPKGTVEDGKAALAWVQTRAQSKIPIIVYGQSLGGAIGMRTVIEEKHNHPNIQLVVADSTFTSYKKAARGILSKNWITWLFQPITYLVLSDTWAPDDRVSEISPIPLLVIHGTKDPVIDPRLGQEVFDYAKDPKEFWSVEGGRHIDAFWVDQGKYRKRFLAKLDSLLAPQPLKK